MKNFLLLLIADAFVAALVVFYWHVAGLSAAECINVFLSVFFALCPLPFVCGSFFALRFARRAAKKEGIRFNSDAAFSLLRQIDTVIFTKVNFIMRKQPLITDILGQGISQNKLLAIAATAEEGASHYAGRAIYNAARNRNLELLRRSAFAETPERGAEAIISGRTFRAGNLQWFNENDIDVSATLLTKSDQLSRNGKIVVFVASGDYARGIIALKDDFDLAAVHTVDKLKERGIALHFMTDSSKRFAAGINEEIDLDIHGEVSALSLIREAQLMRARGAFVAVVGDDATAREMFFAADLSVVVASRAHFGGDVARREREEDGGGDDNFAADLILNENISRLIPAMAIAEKNDGVIRQNRLISAVFAALAAPLAAGVLSLWGVALLPPWVFLAAMLVASLALVVNSAR